jgi:beta-galactosidase
VRKIQNINDGWTFRRGEDSAVTVNIPHCYNSVDGQDGSKMFRGVTTYERNIDIKGEDLRHVIILEVGAASLSSRVFVNDRLCHELECGFSLFRTDITKYLSEGSNKICIEVSNAVDNTIYPAMADFSFYGGIYRDVNIIMDDDLHFEETGRGLDGIYVTPSVKGTDGELVADVFVKRENGYSGNATCKLKVIDREARETVASASEENVDSHVKITVTVPKVRLWEGVDSPVLYDVVFDLYDAEGNLCDERTIATGFRTIEYSPEDGLLLNGRPCKLHGVARHQDFGGLGNAITEKELQTDLKLILEMGANSVRCSHYQHCDRWYELCDEAGLLVWAEILVISSVLQKPKADENAMKHLELLIDQVRNHTSVYCYGVQNEVCMVTKNQYTFDLVDRLSRKARELDDSRLIAQANEAGTEDDSPILGSTDILGYNLYYGWYYGKMEDLQPRLDSIHAANPDKPLILTEYGVDTNARFHSTEPKANDYSEEYQLMFSENAINAIEERKFMAGGYVWNMFDFGSAGRAEGGEKGKNQKGLVTIDRKIKKDAYYLYKAHWSREPFIYIAGRRYVNRPGDKTDITVISNAKEILLKVNGTNIDNRSEDGVMTVFKDVALRPGENVIVACSGRLSDQIIISSVKEPDPSYICEKKTDSDNAINWFEGLDPETMEKADKDELDPGCFSFEDPICDIFANSEAKAVFIRYLRPITLGPRFDESSPITVNALLGFVKALNIPQPLLVACEQELNKIKK